MKSGVVEDETRRLAALNSYRVLDSPPEPAFDDLGRLAAQICGTPMALVSFADSQRMWFKTRFGVDVVESPREGFCGHALHQRDILEVPDASSDPRFKDNAMVMGDPHIRFYAGVPLVDEEGFVLGTLCVLDTKPRRLTAEQRDGLRTLGRQIISELALRRHLMRAQQRQEYYRALAEDGMALICTHQLDGTMCSVNTAALKLLGYTAEEVEGRSLREFVASSNWESVETYLNELQVEGVAAGQLHILTKTGARLIWAFRNRVIHEPDGGAYVLGHAQDVTEQQSALSALRESEERYRELFEDATDLVQSVALDGKILFVNDAWCEALEYAPGSAPGMNLREVIAAEGWPGYSAAVQALIETGKNRQFFETEMRAGSGRRLSVEGNLNCKLENGRPVAIRGMFRDVTQRRSMERRLEQLRLRTQLILDSLTEGIMMIDMQGIVTYANSAALRLLGHFDLGFIGKPLHPTVQHSYQDGSKYPPALSPVRLTMRDGLRRSVNNEIFWRADGTFFPVEYQINAIYEDGLSIGAVLSFHDVTEQRSAESNQKRLTSIIEASTDFVAIVDRAGKPVYLNRAFRRAVGIGENDALTKLSMRDIYAPEIAEKMMTEAIPQTERTGTWSGETMLRGPYGNIPVLQLIMAHRNTTGSVDFFSSVMRDITERLSIETMKDEFVSTVSHELRTPLTSIRGALGLLASGAVGKVPDAGTRMVEVAITNSDRLIRLLNDILDIERMESNKIQLYRSPQRVTDLFAAALEAVKVIADQTGTRVLTDCPPDLFVIADYDRIIQALMNLLSNAMKFSPAGEGVVKISARTEGGMALLSVEDNGRGIPFAKLGVIFERFQQVDASDAREKGGSGLGLAICRSIVQQHGGKIWAESQQGRGSTFCFTLPTPTETSQT